MGQVAKKYQPQGEWLSEQEIAKRCGIHRQTVASRLEELGYEPDEERSNAKLKIHWFDDEMEFAVKKAKDSLDAARIRQIRADAQIKELKLAEARGELVSIHDTTERVQAVISKLYKELTQMQPKRVAPRLVKAKTTAEVVRILKLDTDKILARLRENDEEFVPIPKK
jgi:hypothetical protein